jgi:xanthine dehydrogenase molybdopterin-binding subunit B
MSKVVCKTKRIGGGFGGKETRSAFIAAAVSVPSYLLNRPVKITLDRDVDMMITGQRHSFLGKYKVLLNLHRFDSCFPSHINIYCKAKSCEFFP